MSIYHVDIRSAYLKLLLDQHVMNLKPDIQKNVKIKRMVQVDVADRDILTLVKPLDPKSFHNANVFPPHCLVNTLKFQPQLEFNIVESTQVITLV